MNENLPKSFSINLDRREYYFARLLLPMSIYLRKVMPFLCYPDLIHCWYMKRTLSQLHGLIIWNHMYCSALLIGCPNKWTSFTSLVAIRFQTWELRYSHRHLFKRYFSKEELPFFANCWIWYIFSTLHQPFSDILFNTCHFILQFDRRVARIKLDKVFSQ
jgi:hypothetical protein